MDQFVRLGHEIRGMTDVPMKRSKQLGGSTCGQDMPILNQSLICWSDYFLKNY